MPASPPPLSPDVPPSSAQLGEGAPTGPHQGVHFVPLQTRPCAQKPSEVCTVQGVPAGLFAEAAQSKPEEVFWHVVSGPQGGAPLSGSQWAVHTVRPGMGCPLFEPPFALATMQDAPLAQSAAVAQKGLHKPLL
jgi:hypothetical protein